MAICCLRAGLQSVARTSWLRAVMGGKGSIDEPHRYWGRDARKRRRDSPRQSSRGLRRDCSLRDRIRSHLFPKTEFELERTTLFFQRIFRHDSDWKQSEVFENA